jgi:hypothetical protein
MSVVKIRLTTNRVYLQNQGSHAKNLKMLQLVQSYKDNLSVGNVRSYLKLPLKHQL